MAPPADIVTRGTSGVVLPPEVSAEIWQNIQQNSTVMQVSPSTDLPGAGTEVQVITGDPVANWTAEANEIGASKPTLGNKLMQGYKLGVVVPFSNEFRRDKTALYGALVSRLPRVLALKFDNTVFYGTDGAGTAPGSNFDTLFSASAVNVLEVTGSTPQSAYDQYLSAVGLVATANIGANLGEWVLSPQGEVQALGVKDGVQRPLFISDVQRQGSIGSILARPVFRSYAVYAAGAAGSPGTPETLGFAGDWSYSTWGQVQGVTIGITDQATITVDGSPLNLWQSDMFAVKATIEVGFRVRSTSEFVKLTGATPAA